MVSKSGGQPIYGCPYCDMLKPCLEDSEFNLLCLANLGESHEAFVAAGSNRKDQAYFQNCMNPNILSGNPDTLVLEILFPPEVEKKPINNYVMHFLIYFIQD